MSWPKLRKGKSPSSLVRITERNDQGRDGRQQSSNPSRSVRTPSPDADSPVRSGPPAWPGVPSQRQQPSGTAEQAPPQPAAPGAAAAAPGAAYESAGPESAGPESAGPESAEPPGYEQAGYEPTEADSLEGASFWDWSPDDDAEQLRFSIDDDAARAPEQAPDEPVIVDGTVVAESPGGQEPAYMEEAPARAQGRTEGRREGIGHRLGGLDHIFGHSRMGMWRRRVVIAVVIAVVVSILLHWQYGVTLAVLFVVGDTIFRARTPATASSLSGVKLTRAQRQTQSQLSGLEKSGYKALHSRLIPNSEDHIDHLVIGPAGVFAIDSEFWDKHLPVRTKNARQLWLGPFSMKDRLEHARWEAEQASELLTRAAGPQLLSRLPGGRVQVRSAMAVYGPKISWDVATIRDVDVFKGGRLRIYLRRYGRRNDVPHLDATEVDQLHTAAHRAFPHLNPGILAPQPA